jgi:hypothetical protein
MMTFLKKYRLSFLLGVLCLSIPAAHAFAETAAGANFTTLTSIPALKEATLGADGLAKLFDGIYKICIGVAATAAVFQIMFEGLKYMGGDSVSETKEARKKIAMAVFGIVVVLSPIVVFNLINPKILQFNIGLSDLGSKSMQNAVQTAPVAPTTQDIPPPSVIQSTGKANTACLPMPDGYVLHLDGTSNDNLLEQCCANQTKGNVTYATAPAYTNSGAEVTVCRRQ